MGNYTKTKQYWRQVLNTTQFMLRCAWSMEPKPDFLDNKTVSKNYKNIKKNFFYMTVLINIDEMWKPMGLMDPLALHTGTNQTIMKFVFMYHL